MAVIDFRKWQSRTILAVILALIIFGGILSVTPIYGLNITPQSTQGSSYVGGSFGNLIPLTHQGYTGG